MRNYLKDLIEEMIQEYRENGEFSLGNVNELYSWAKFETDEVSEQINKFHMIATEIALNGGMPVLKRIYSMV